MSNYNKNGRKKEKRLSTVANKLGPIDCGRLIDIAGKIVSHSGEKEYIFSLSLPIPQSNYWLNTILLEQGFEHERNTVLQTLNDNGIKARPVWTLLHKLPMYKDCPQMDLSTAESLEARLINIPSSVRI
jgi:dTDP-4-amino-4,6-dideoxygalactose transaminase